MTVFRTAEDVRRALARTTGIGFVPTMGALHAGHMTLVERSKATCPVTVVSIFVNPSQFSPGEDLENYPRREEQDLAMCEKNGVNVVFMPSREEVYHGAKTSVHVVGAAELWEGDERPGHFDGVATIVLKLFNIVRPEVAFFGLKDLQQCAVVQQMVRDFDLELRLEFVETVREDSGLAMSSRNDYFAPADRARAAGLYRCLNVCADDIRQCPSEIEEALSHTCQALETLGFQVGYLALVDPSSMRPTTTLADGARIIVAAKFCGVRLIDNVAI